MTGYASPFCMPFLETRKMKRTGFCQAFLGGGALAALVPVVNMALRAETFTSQPGSPFQILMEANWQLMAQLNIFLLVCGACLLYHTEYADNGLQKAQSLPLGPSGLFLGKLGILLSACLIPLCLETASLILCCMRWFPDRPGESLRILTGMAFAFAVLLPTGAAMLLLSSMCRNMWISLGAGVILVLFASMLPASSSSVSDVLALVPFCGPYRMLHELPGREAALWTVCLCLGEGVLLCAAERVYQSIRRYFA